MQIIEVPEVEREGGEGLFEQIIDENFPSLGKETGLQVQEAQRITPKINKNRSIPQHIIVKLAKFRDTEKILKNCSGQEVLNLQEWIHKAGSRLSAKTWQARKD